MQQTIHGNLLPHCNSYEGAVRVFNEAHQHKRFDEWRGLKDKRDTSKLIRMVGEAVIFRFHHTDLVEWRPKELRVRTWSSMSSAVFLNQFLPGGMYAKSGRKEMYVEHDGLSYQPGAGPLVFHAEGDKWIIDPETVLRWKKEVLDKSRAAHIRKILKLFMDWKATLDRLKHGRIEDTSTAHAVAMGLLQGYFDEGAIPQDAYPRLRNNSFVYSKDFMQQCYVLGGAVGKVEAPLGELQGRTRPYAGLSAWSFI